MAGSRFSRRSIGLFLALAALAGFAWGTRWIAGRYRSASNVLILTLDTTRADRLGPYGFRQADTPNLDRLAGESVLFDQTESVAPLTLPAHVSLFTGRLPFQHGVRDNGAVLDSAQQTLAQLLHARGLRTGAFVASYVLDAQWGLDRGFDTYDGHFEPRRRDGSAQLDDVRRSADEVVDRALTWLDGASTAPFFAWLHFYDAHAPYDPPYDRPIRAPGYDGAIAFMDAQLGRVLAFLDARGLRDRTVVVVVGDHGESLGEHGERRHGLFVYEAVTRVPLIIRAPGSRMRGRRVQEVVRSVDVLPTVLDLLGVEPPAALAGTSLVDRMAGRRHEDDLPAYSETMYPRYHFGWSELHALRSGRFKLIAAPRPELYDLESDPGEQHNLYETRSALARGLGSELRKLQEAGSGKSVRAAIDPDARERLAALGYVGGSTADDQLPADLPDPKDKITLYEMITGDRAIPSPGGVADSQAGIRRPSP